MGIKGLWTVLTPFSEKKSLHEIRGETIAVDLSGWICDSQNVTDYYIQPKLYLRNLFFRTIYLLLADVNPIFALEGDAPELKRDVMAARNAVQFRGAAPRSEAAATRKPDIARKRFRNVLKECESLLKCMGVQCIKGDGEAEATCAQLNAQVVSQDSDCFAYGARKVYRNFSVSNAAGGGAMAGSVDCYDADLMFQSTGFGRNKMVALAILCGCDYGVGACGSSINTVVTFLHTVPDNEIIPRLLSWITDPEHYAERARWASTPGRCDRCGHGGRTHLKNGCPMCVTHRGCNDTGHKAKVAEVKRELSLRNRALTCGMTFPEPKVMREFNNISKQNIDIDTSKTQAPSLIQFVKLMTNKLDWSERYCVVKFLPLLTKWHLQQNVPCRTITPVKINKKRNPRGVPSFEVVWSDIEGQYADLIPDDQIEDGEDPSLPWTSTERQDLMHQFYPHIVEAYEECIKKPPKEKKTKGRKKKDDAETDKPQRKYNRKVKKIVNVDIQLANLSGTLKNMSLAVKQSDPNSTKSNISVSVKKLKRKLKKGQKTMDSFIAKKRRKSGKKSILTVGQSFKNLSLNIDKVGSLIEKENQTNCRLLATLETTDNNIKESDLSDIVDKIVKRAPLTKTAKFDNNVFKLVFDKYSTPKKSFASKSVLKEIRYCSTPNASPIRRNSPKFCANNSSFNNSITKVNTSFFFDKLTDDRDAFEISMDYKHKSAIINVDSDTTVDYSLPDVCL